MLFFLLFNIIFAIISATAGNDCEIENFDQVESIVKSCTDITIKNLVVPAGITLELDLKEGTTLTFTGVTTFEHTPWSGPLIRLRGSKITVQGTPGSLLNGQGELYWDHIGDKGPKKPQFMKIEAFDGSVIKNLNILNCPHHCIYIGRSDGLTISGWVIDNSLGDQNNFTGHNTDGFDVSAATNLIIENTSVINQDDCVAIRYGSNILVRNMYCAGGHGLSLSAGFNYTSYTENTVKNVTIRDSVIVRSANGIHVKTHADAYKGLIEDVTYENIYLSGITNFGVNVQQDYINGSSSGVPNNNIPIHNLKLINIQGNVLSTESNNAMKVYILCGNKGCEGWEWSNVNITGGAHSSVCNYIPAGYEC
ncbi:polygalacturonase-like [Diorhabda sublineata]|uniref:polygalacturonase-like n=1 Tax=Diorhabda sublineata TaxID=1163346 RepID=UPI0024E0A8CB|nr:polygalacturonase-like [Diorhabda sublineata]